MTKPNVIASRIVTWDLQEQFAALSGDRNPLHVDEVAARRTQAGQPVVHGVHTLLWALDSLVASGRVVSSLVRVKAKFLKWVYLDDVSTLSLPLGEELDPRAVQVDVLGMPVLTVDLSYADAAPVAAGSLSLPLPNAPLLQPLERSLADLKGLVGNAFTASAADVRAFFPQLADYLTGEVVAEITACSYVVGMEAPGLLSTFSKLDLTFRVATNAMAIRSGLQYRVSDIDDRFRKARLAVTGRCIEGSLDVFVRLPPVEQATMNAVAEHVQPTEFAGMQALIVGGSRGLGELTAKLITAGGGKATLTYARGKVEAERVAREIRQWGGEVDVLQYDVRQHPEAQLSELNSPISHLFYFATNPIFRPKGNLVSSPILADFVIFYLHGFHDLCMQMLQSDKPYALKTSKLIAYYPSSVAIEERPAGMTEYSMAKAAGEQMCRDMNQYLSNLRILITRLPRLRTDQTATVIPSCEIDPITVILPIIRETRSLAAGC